MANASALLRPKIQFTLKPRRAKTLSSSRQYPTPSYAPMIDNLLMPPPAKRKCTLEMPTASYDVSYDEQDTLDANKRTTPPPPLRPNPPSYDDESNHTYGNPLYPHLISALTGSGSAATAKGAASSGVWPVPILHNWNSPPHPYFDSNMIEEYFSVVFAKLSTCLYAYGDILPKLDQLPREDSHNDMSRVITVSKQQSRLRRTMQASSAVEKEKLFLHPIPDGLTCTLLFIGPGCLKINFWNAFTCVFRDGDYAANISGGHVGDLSVSRVHLHRSLSQIVQLGSKSV